MYFLIGPCKFLQYESKNKQTVSVNEVLYWEFNEYAIENLNEFIYFIN